MIYVGHFSCGDIVMERQGEPWHALFTVVVDAGNVTTAIRKLKQFVKTFAARHDDLFDGVKDIYLDACVEIAHVPKSGVLTYIRLREGEDFGGVSSVLLGSSGRGVASYRWGPPDEDTEQETTVEPFVRLAPRRQRSVSKAGQVLHLIEKPTPAAHR